GQQNVYTFTIGQKERVYFDSLTNNGDLNWTLSGPQGMVVAPSAFNAGDVSTYQVQALDLLPGEYTLTVAGSGDAVGPYRFRLFDLAQAAPLTPNVPVTQTLPPATTQAYQFDARAGDRFFFALGGDGALAGFTYWRLLDPFGTVVFQHQIGGA